MEEDININDTNTVQNITKIFLMLGVIQPKFQKKYL